MFLRSKTRTKNGKRHHYWSVVENRRVAGGRVLQHHVLYLGEISGSQQEAWQKSIEVFEDGQARPKTVALLPDDCLEADECRAQSAPGQWQVVRIKLSVILLRTPVRQNKKNAIFFVTSRSKSRNLYRAHDFHAP